MTDDLLTLTSDIVSAHVSHNSVDTADLPTLIRSTYEALQKLGQAAAQEIATAQPAVSIRASIKPDYLVCLEDGKRLTMLKRYLRTNYGMSPDDYRAKWGLPRDYPMVAPNYAARRSAFAQAAGLGRKKAVEAARATVTAARDTVESVAEPIMGVVKTGKRKLGIAAAKAAAAAHLGEPAPTPAKPRKAASPRAPEVD